mmetsp:Transcript_7034/g.7762  ORF Transcript_7034/g.7762 Transcript_7034/m.7762 type:complete len:381 (+) Transcript_7034:59-1201(+)
MVHRVLKVLVAMHFVVNEMNALTSSKSKSKKPSGRSTGGGGFGSVSKPTSLIHTLDTGEKSQLLLQFLALQNAKGLENAEIGYHQITGVRGLFGTTKLKKNQIICKIPSDCALALADPTKSEKEAPTSAHRGANFLDMYVKKEAAKKFWSPYLDTLPVHGSTTFDPTPDFFIDDDIELFEFPRVIQRAKERRKKIAELSGERGLTIEELQFATWLTTSRSFKLSIPTPPDENDIPECDERGQIIDRTKEKDAFYVMVPFIDIANHDSDQSNCKLTLIDPEKDEAWFALEATRPIAAGKELVIAYGNGIESTVELLLNYGFVPSSNRIDKLMLSKGGDDTIASVNDWTTSLEEDKAMLEMAKEDPVLKLILTFRIRLKEAY